MSKRFSALEPEHHTLFAAAPVFFMASAAATGRVNVSPRSTRALRILDASTVAYLDETGSGNETAAHVRAGGRLTLMVCAFAGPPSILRLYGHGRILRRGSAAYADLLARAFAGSEPSGARQIVVLDIDLVQTSCGYGVPLLRYEGERTTLVRWAEHTGEAGLARYRRERNARSLDGFPTGIEDDAALAP